MLDKGLKAALLATRKTIKKVFASTGLLKNSERGELSFHFSNRKGKGEYSVPSILITAKRKNVRCKFLLA